MQNYGKRRGGIDAKGERIRSRKKWGRRREKRGLIEGGEGEKEETKDGRKR